MSEQQEKPKTEEQNLLVALRVRPINEDEIACGAAPIAHKVDNKMVVLQDPTEDPDDILRVNRSREKQYMFDIALDGSTQQRDVYEKTCKFLIPGVICGFNATVFAYGATGAGKTYTMLGTDDDPGIMALALNDLFLEMERTYADMSYKVSMSYLEIYNEMIRDLLNPTSGVLDLREDARGVQVSGLSEINARSTDEVMEILMQGNKERTQEPTAANKTSSRSHAILQIQVQQRSRVKGLARQVRLGKLFLIDLAGSERAANTHNRGQRMVEGAHINRSLLALGNCINALSDRNASRYVNYRDSKLTRLLKDALGGNCKTVMIAHISPASIHFEESRNTLAYADRAKQIKTKVRRNVLDVTYHIAQYTNIINELREEVKRLRSKLDQNSLSSRNSAALKAIKSEVIDPGKRGSPEMQKLKDLLLAVFRDQMELRRSLMELNNTVMEISLETTRNQLLIRRHERDKTTRKAGMNSDETESKYQAEEKGMDSEATLDNGEEPGEVRVAREELKALEREQDHTERLKHKLVKGLDNAKEKAAKLEEVLPQQANTAEQREVLSLMCKVHELEIENMEMQSVCLLRQFELRRRDMALAKLAQHRGLCQEIIVSQRQLLESNQVEPPRELDELYELWQQDTQQLLLEQEVLPDIHVYKSTSVSTIRRPLESDSMTDIDRLSAVEEHPGRLHLPKLEFTSVVAPKVGKSHRTLSPINQTETEDQIFSRSPLARELDAQGVGSPHKLRVANSYSGTPTGTTPHINSRQKSIITLSSTESPSPPADVIEEAPAKQRQAIMSDTRSIAALAARRRHMVQRDTLASESQPSLSEAGYHPRTFLTEARYTPHEPENYLSESRLAQHDDKFGVTSNHSAEEPHLAHHSQTRNSEKKQKRRQERALYRNMLDNRAAELRQSKQSKTGGETQRSRKSKGNTAAYQQLSKATPRKAEAGDPRKHGTKNSQHAAFKSKPHSTQQNGHGTNRSVNTDSSSSTAASKSKKPLPTIAGYRQGDITITGVAVKNMK